MKALVLTLASLALLSFAPAPAQAHVDTCPWGDLECYAECETSHAGPDPHLCGFETPRSRVGVEPCDPPQVGVRVLTGGGSIDACLPEPLRVEECPWWQNGYVVYVFGRPVTDCFA